MDFRNFIRPNILNLKPYSSARHEFTGVGEVFLDANENPYNTLVNRYPDPLQAKVKEALSKIKGIPPDQIFLGNGSDESIDLIIRIFCEPGADEIIVLPPTYGMYEVSADIANVKVNKVPLNDFFQPEVKKILAHANEKTKVLFICSPNNPTGALINKKDIIELLESFNGIVVIDEAYIDFAQEVSCADLISKYPQLILLQTLSKAWGLAGVRLGMAIAAPEMIHFFNKVKAPYNISILTQDFVLDKLKNPTDMESQVKEIIHERERLLRELPQLNEVVHVYPTNANFILVKMKDANKTYFELVKHGVVVRNRSKDQGCENCLRITVGTKSENETLLKILSN